MKAWPKSQLIKIIRARRNYYGPIDSGYAFRCPNGAYLLLTDDADEGYLIQRRGDCIYEWEDVAAVPTASLKRLQDVFQGASRSSAGLSERQLAAVLEVTSNLPADKHSPLARAASQVGDMLRTRLLAPDAPPEKYLALVLGALATLQGADPASQPQVLATIVQSCVEWLAEVTPPDKPLCDPAEIVREVRARAESDPAVGEFPAMAALAGDAATWVDEARNTEEGRRRLALGLVEPVLTLAHYALALLAECLEDGE